MNRFRAPVVVFFLTFLLTSGRSADASLLGEAAELAEKASIRAARVDSVARIARIAAKASHIPKANATAISLFAAGTEIRAINAANVEVVVAHLPDTGPILLTADGDKLLQDSQVVVDESDVEELAPLLAEGIRRRGDASYIRSDDSIGRVILDPLGDAEVGDLLIEKYAHLFVPMSGESKDLIWTLGQPFNHENVRIVSLLHETDTDELAQLDNVAGEFHVPAGSRSVNDVVAMVQSMRRKKIFVLGHVEDKQFVIRDAAGQIATEIPLDLLEDAADKAEASLFLLGCGTGSNSTVSGFLGDVNALNVAAGIQAAFDSRDFGEAMSALANQAGDIILRPDKLRPNRISSRIVELSPEPSLPRALRLVGFSTVNRDLAVELGARLIPEVPTMIQYPFVIALFIAFVSRRSALKTWKAQRKPAPRFRARPAVHLSVKFIRFTGALFTLPLAVVLEYMILFGPWIAFIYLLGAYFWSPLLWLFLGWRWMRLNEPDPTQPRRWRYVAIPVFSMFAGFIANLVILGLALLGISAEAYTLPRELVGVASGVGLFLVLARVPKAADLRWRPAFIRGLVVKWPFAFLDHLAAMLIKPKNVHGI